MTPEEQNNMDYLRAQVEALTMSTTTLSASLKRHETAFDAQHRRIRSLETSQPLIASDSCDDQSDNHELVARFLNGIKHGSTLMARSCNNHLMIFVADLARAIKRERGPVHEVTVCVHSHHDGPFVIGVRDGDNVWLRNDGTWTENEVDPACTLEEITS